jgi:hypothetical protein
MRSAPARRSLPLLALLPLLATGCGTVKSPTEPPPAAGGAAFTFAQIQSQVFTPSCAKSGCHARSAASGGLVLEAGAAYGEIVGRAAQENPGLSRIAPGDPERSYLLKKIRGDADISGSRMPQDGPPFLSAAQIDGIAGWIRAGAPNN